MFVKFTGMRDVADNIYSFVFEKPQKLSYTAGQFIELTIDHKDKDSRGSKRWFTLSSSPTEDELVITTKCIPEHISSFKQALLNLSPGTVVPMTSPMGDFVLPKDTNKELVFIAGGIGVTPMRSMIKYIVDTGEHRKVELIYGANSGGEVAFNDLFTSANIPYTRVIREGQKDEHDQDGTLDAARILELAGNNKDKTYYLSGPEPMIEAFKDGLEQLGVKNILCDFFPGYSK